MKILLTGAAGDLGRAIQQEGRDRHEFVCFDFKPPQQGESYVVGDVRNLDLLKEAAQGCNAIIHTAAFHGGFLKDHSRFEFIEVNCGGADNVLQAAVANGIKKVVLSSTLDVYGHTYDEMGSRVLDEEVPPNPETVYGMTKLLSEGIGRYYAKRFDINVACLRYAAFDKNPWHSYGISLTGRYVWVGDVAQANLLAAESDRVKYEVFHISTRTRLRPEDLLDCVRNAEVVLERRWPGSVEVLKAHNVRITNSLYPIVDIGKAERLLGYDPRYNFEQYIEWLKTQ